MAVEIVQFSVWVSSEVLDDDNVILVKYKVKL